MCVLPATTLLCLLSAAPTEEDPQLVAKIAGALRAHQQSIESLHVEYALRRQPGGLNREEDVYPDEHWTWAREGVRELLASEPWNSPGSGFAFPGRHWYSFDGSKGHELFFHQSDVNIPKMALVSTQPPNGLRWHAHFPFYLGWRVLGTEESVLSLLERPGPKPIFRQQEVHGVPCIGCEVGTFQTGDDPEHIVVCWFDEANGWLPRRIVVCATESYRHPPPRGTVGKDGSLVSVVEVAEFQDVEDELLGGTLTLPLRMESHDVAPYEIEVESVALNTRLPPAMFRPEIPDGTEVVEGEGTSREWSSIVGGAEAEALHAQRNAADRMLIMGPESEPGIQARVAAGKPVDATPTTRSLSTWMLAASVVALLLAVVARRRGW